MSTTGWRLFAALALFCLLMMVVAQTTSLGLHAQDRSQRKPIVRVAPKYPEGLRKQQLGGIVHLSVVIAPDGTVKSVKPISGNPALVDAAIDAVKQWKFEPANGTDTDEIQFEFRPE